MNLAIVIDVEADDEEEVMDKIKEVLVEVDSCWSRGIIKDYDFEFLD